MESACRWCSVGFAALCLLVGKFVALDSQLARLPFIDDAVESLETAVEIVCMVWYCNRTQLLQFKDLTIEVSFKVKCSLDIVPCTYVCSTCALDEET